MADDEHLRTLFTTFDRDGSGTLDAEELVAILTRGASGLSLDDAKDIVNDFDDNKDGVLSVDEFVKAMGAVGGELSKVPAVGAHVRVTSGHYTGRVGVVLSLPDIAAMDADNAPESWMYDEGGNEVRAPRPKAVANGPVAYTIHFLDGSAGRATIAEQPPVLDPTVAHLYELTTEGTLQVIDKAELAAVVRADRAKRDAERKALDAAQEAELQVEWEKRGKSGRVPRVGSERTSPIAPEWWDLPWFDAWVAGGCDHQLLGISVEGMERLLEDWGECLARGTDRNGCRISSRSLLDTFRRDMHVGLEWVTEAFGQQEDTGPIGYDLGHFVRIWDLVSGDADKSVLEVVLTRRQKYTTQEIVQDGGQYRWQEDLQWRWQTYEATESFHWTQHVGPAHVFYSHVQLKPVRRTLQVIKGALAKSAPTRKLLELAEGEKPRVWLDYFNLRQCGNDFKPAAVVDLIKQIGVCFIEFDTDPTQYLARTFCALEAFAAVKGGVKTGVLVDEIHAIMIKDMLAASPIKVADAQTRRRKDKDMIDAFITESVGFEALDAALTKLALDGAQAICDRAFTTARIFRLDSVGLDASCVPAIVELLKGAKQLQTLSLKGNAFDEPSATAIAAAAREKSVSVCGFTKKELNLEPHEFPRDKGFGTKGDIELIFAISDCKVRPPRLMRGGRLTTSLQRCHRPWKPR